MQRQFENRVLDSFLFTVDHTLLYSGRAFTNYSGLLYPMTGSLYGYSQYTTPYRQLVNDVSISGANVMSGVWVTGVYSPPGTSNVHSINISEGTVFFSNNARPSLVSGNFAIKDFSIYTTFDHEEKILFETKFELRPKHSQVVSGLSPSAQTLPVIYIKPMGGQDVPACLGGVDNRISRFRAIVLSDSQYLTDAACAILRRMANKNVKIIETTGMGLNALGGYTGVHYNYETLANAATDQSFIVSAKVSNLMEARQFSDLNPSVFPAFVDFELWHFV